MGIQIDGLIHLVCIDIYQIFMIDLNFIY